MAAAGPVADPGGAGGRDPWTIEPSPRGLIEAPLDFVFAEHLRQREAAVMLSMIADGEFDPSGVRALIAFLETDFALHVGDEEIILFPALKAHCRPEDEVDQIIARLADEHKEDEALCGEAIAILRARLGGEKPSAAESRRLRSFSDHVRRHLALENGVLLPIARVRIGPDALKSISESLKRRRGR